MKRIRDSLPANVNVVVIIAFLSFARAKNEKPRDPKKWPFNGRERYAATHM